MNLQLLSRLKTRDAAVIYEYLFELNNRAAGEIKDMTFDSIAAGLNAAGLKTGRGSKFTAVVVRNRFSELEDVEIVERVETVPGSFNLFVFMYPGAVGDRRREQAVEETPASDPYKGRTLFDYSQERAPIESKPSPRFHFQNENENENDKDEKQSAHTKEEYININKKINNQDFEVEAEEDARPSTSDVRTLVDFTDPKVARFRKEIVKRAWEPSINPDLIDRIVAIAVLKIGGADSAACFAMIRDAKDAVRRYENTDGRAGRSKIWETLAWSAKRVYDTNGWKWTPTRIGSEPRPECSNGLAKALAAVRAEMEDDE